MCTEDFVPVTTERQVGCEFHRMYKLHVSNKTHFYITIFSLFRNNSKTMFKVCDFITFEGLVKWNRQNNVFDEVPLEIEST